MYVSMFQLWHTSTSRRRHLRRASLSSSPRPVERPPRTPLHHFFPPRAPRWRGPRHPSSAPGAWCTCRWRPRARATSRDEVVAGRAPARPVVVRQVVQTHAVGTLALQHHAHARVFPGTHPRARSACGRRRLDRARCDVVAVGTPVALCTPTRNASALAPYLGLRSGAKKRARVENAHAYVCCETKLMLK